MPSDSAPPSVKNQDYEMVNSPAPLDKNENSNLLNSEFISLIAEGVQSVQEWKEISVGLQMDEDTISFIENENSDLKLQCTKILQLWKVNTFLNIS